MLSVKLLFCGHRKLSIWWRKQKACLWMQTCRSEGVVSASWVLELQTCGPRLASMLNQSEASLPSPSPHSSCQHPQLVWDGSGLRIEARSVWGFQAAETRIGMVVAESADTSWLWCCRFTGGGNAGNPCPQVPGVTIMAPLASVSCRQRSLISPRGRRQVRVSGCESR